MVGWSDGRAKVRDNSDSGEARERRTSRSALHMASDGAGFGTGSASGGLPPRARARIAGERGDHCRARRASPLSARARNPNRVRARSLQGALRCAQGRLRGLPFPLRARGGARDRYASGNAGPGARPNKLLRNAPLVSYPPSLPRILGSCALVRFFRRRASYGYATSRHSLDRRDGPRAS